MCRFLCRFALLSGVLACLRVTMCEKSRNDLACKPFISSGKILVRNEEAAGSSPATSTTYPAVE